ncbi:MAG: hypothetical protein ABI572_06915 [Actinomycetota bacterium]
MTLRIIVQVLAVLVVLGALVAWRSAPAVTVALVVGLAAAVVTYVVVRADGPRGVPAAAAEGFSVGIVVGGLLGLALTRRRARGTWPMRRDALWLLVATPFAAAALLLSVQEACPLYVTRGAGLCYYDVDLMGGWAAGVAFLFVVDMGILAGLLWLAPGPSE